MKYGLALGGGGARGAFEAGVWRALGEMGKEITAIAGTSIGAINGAAFLSDADVDSLWRQIEAADIVPDSEDENILSAGSIAANFSGLIKGGLDTEPLKELISSFISEEKVRRAATEFGICAYSATRKKPVELFCDAIPDGELIDYITASACFPVFKPVRIGGEELLDGGLCNNIPENMLIQRDCDTIISVSVSAPGIVRRINGKGVNIIEIKCERTRQGVLEFDRGAAVRNMQGGYLACMKAFGKYMGSRYFISSRSYHAAARLYGEELIADIETAAELSGAERIKEYTFTELVRAVLAIYRQNEKLRDETERIEKGSTPIIKGDRRGKLFRAANAILYIKSR